MLENNQARCWREFCDYPAKHDVRDGWGFCSMHHNVGYYWAGKPVYRKEKCNTCKESV